MTEKFIPLSDSFLAAPQIAPQDVTAAAQAGVKLIVNNRPDGEMIGQPKSNDIARAADAAGLAYVHIPVDGRGISSSHISALKNALEENRDGKTLAFCASGLRSTILHACVEASKGRAATDIIAEAAAAGYDIRRFSPTLEALTGAA